MGQIFEKRESKRYRQINVYYGSSQDVNIRKLSRKRNMNKEKSGRLRAT